MLVTGSRTRPGLQIDAAILSAQPASSVEATLAARSYVVRQGDTLSAISARYGLDVSVLAARNALADPDRIEVGQVLQVDPSHTVRLGLPADGDLTRVQLWPWPPVQGQTLVVWLQASRPVTFNLSLAGQTYPVVADGRHGWALVPIPALAEPGAKPLAVVAGQTAITLPIPVGAGVFDRYDIPASASAPILSQQDKVRAEATRMKALFEDYSPAGWTPRDRFRAPIATGYPHSSPYGSRRTYGGGQTVSAHEGEDFSAPSGTPVYAPAAGVVVLAEPLFVRGNAVALDHGHGVITGYWHLESLNVSLGESVKPGQLLGKVGSTGLSTGAHLHWELRVNGVAVDPLQWVAG